ncbi:24371_t:CDS:2, partial [Racocetra persica]
VELPENSESEGSNKIYDNLLSKYYFENQMINEEENKNFNIGEINKEQKRLLEKLLKKYKDVFVWDSTQLGKMM